jgi:hypothetical protein
MKLASSESLKATPRCLHVAAIPRGFHLLQDVLHALCIGYHHYSPLYRNFISYPQRTNPGCPLRSRPAIGLASCRDVERSPSPSRLPRLSERCTARSPDQPRWRAVSQLIFNLLIKSRSKGMLRCQPADLNAGSSMSCSARKINKRRNQSSQAKQEVFKSNVYGFGLLYQLTSCYRRIEIVEAPQKD